MKTIILTKETKDTIKTITNVLLLLILAYTAYTMTTPQGKELIECRTYAPGLQLVKECIANQSHFTCVKNIDAETNLSTWYIGGKTK